MSDVIGSAEFELRASRDQLKRDLDAAERDIKQTAGRAERDLNDAGSNIGTGLGGIAAQLKVGFLAVAAVIALAAKSAFEFSFAALRMADDISDAAKRVGVSTDALQEFRAVAKATGRDAADADRSLDSFGRKLAGAASGLDKESLASFRSLGFKPEDLRGFGSVEEGLENVIDRIGELGSAADRAAIADRLGLDAFSGALAVGSEEVARLRDEAISLGFVMDAELIRRASQAQKQFDDLSQIIDIQLKSALVDLAPVLLGLLDLVSKLARAFGNLADSIRSADQKSDAGLAAASTRLQSQLTANLAAMNRPGFGGADAVAVRNQAINTQRQLDAVNAEIAERARASIARGAGADRGVEDGSGRRLILPPERTRSRRAVNSADREAEREARRAERVEQEIFRARQRLLDVVDQEQLTAQQRFDLAQQQLDMDRQARDAEIESKATRGEINDAERRALEAAHAEADALEDRVLADTAFREIQDERLANERLLSSLTADLVSLQVGAARTAEERRRLELELLEITQRQRRAALQLELDRNPSLTPEQRAAALATNDRINQLETAAANRRNMGPLDQWRDASLKSAAEVREAYESIAARGLDSLNEGLVDAIMNTRSLGEVFSNVAKQILADLLSISVRRGITEPLANALFGQSGQGAGGGGFGGLFSAGLSGLGNMFSGGFRGLSLPSFGSGLASVASAAAQRVMVTVGVNDDRFNAYVDGRAAPMAQSYSQGAYQGARQTVPADMARADRYSLR